MANAKGKACIIEVGDKEQLSDLDIETLKSLEDTFHDMAEVYGNDTASLNKAYKEFIDEHLIDVKYSSARVIGDTVKTNALIKATIDPEDMKGSIQRLLDLTEGSHSIETNFRSLNTQLKNMMVSPLVEAKLYKPFAAGEFDIELREISNRMGKGLTDYSDISADAMRVWKALEDVNQKALTDMQLAGLNVRKKIGYLTSRNYDFVKILEAGEGDVKIAKEYYVDTMLNKYIDHENTFHGDMSDVQKREIIGQMFEDIRQSQKNTLVKEKINKSAYLNRLKGRKINMLTGALEHEFNQEFGTGKSVFESMLSQMERNAKTTANVSRLGTKTEVSYGQLTDAFYTAFQGKMPEAKLDKLMTKFQRSYNIVVLPTHSPVGGIEKAVNLVRMVHGFTKLGSSLFAALWDTNISAFNYAVKTNGNQFAGVYEGLKATLKVISPESRRELSKILNVDILFTDPAILLGGNAGDFDSGFGKVTTAMNNFFLKASKLTGVPWQTEISRTVNGILHAKAFQKMIDAPDNLNPLQVAALKEFELGVDDLKFIGANAKKNSVVDAVTASDILEISTEAYMKRFNLKSKRAALRRRQKLFEKYTNYIESGVYKGTPTPNAKVKRHLGKHNDNPYRIAADLIMQFKETAWKIAVDNKEGFEKLHQANGNKAVASGLGQYMALAMPSYLAFESIRAMVNNRPLPHERFQEALNGGEDGRELFFDFLNKSSIAPLVTDFADRLTSDKFGSEPSKFFLGPTGGMIDDAANIFKRKNKQEAGARFIKRHALPSTWFPFKAWDRNYGDYESLTNRRITRD